jgi:hypothetical protein
VELNLLHDGPATPEQIALLLPAAGLDLATQAHCRYRTPGGSWREGHPLYRIRPEFSTTPIVGSVDDAFAWPILGVSPGVAYEIEVTVSLNGSVLEVVQLAHETRALPPYAGAANKTVNPTMTGAQIQAVLNGLVPGDVLEFLDGVYFPTGIWQLSRAGTPSAPITLRGQSRAGVVVNIANPSTSGAAAFIGVGMQHTTLESMTLQGPGVDSGTPSTCHGIRLHSSVRMSHLTFRHLTLRGVDKGITAEGPNDACLVYLNTLLGNNRWTSTFLETNAGWNDDAIRLPGKGNCAFNNTIIGFGDGLAYAHHAGSTSSTEANAVHFYRNELRNCCDDAFEGDYAQRNCSYYDNRSHNSMTFSSFDPLFGGPFVVARNIAINLGRTACKWNDRQSGQFLYNNTVVMTRKQYSMTSGNPLDTREAIWWQPNNGPQKAYGFRNNVTIYRGPGKQSLRLDNFGHEPIDFDHNSWFPDMPVWRFGTPTYTSLAQAQAATVTVTPIFSGFTKRLQHDNITVSNPFTEDIVLGESYRDEVTQTYLPILLPGSSPKGSGVVIPNITDGFIGAAPDRGAVIDGRALVQYGDFETTADTQAPAAPLVTAQPAMWS